MSKNENVKDCIIEVTSEDRAVYIKKLIDLLFERMV